MCIVISYIIFLTFLTQPPSRAPSFRRRGVASPRGPGEESGKEPVRFDSFRFRNWFVLIRFGSVRFGNRFGRFDAVRPALFNASLLGPVSVRSGSAFGSGRFRNQTARFGSAGSVFLFVVFMCVLVVSFLFKFIVNNVFFFFFKLHYFCEFLFLNNLFLFGLLLIPESPRSGAAPRRTSIVDAFLIDIIKRSTI